VPAKRQFSSGDFLVWLRDYLSGDSSIHEHGAAGGEKVKLSSWRENRFYRFDAEAVAAICHGIEVFALEEANGKLTALLGDFRDFEAHSECYLQMAATIETVEVLGFGRAPRSLRHLQFRQDERTKQYRGVIYQGEKQPAMFLCRSEPNSKRSHNGFVGFYSLDRPLVARFAAELQNSAEKQPLREFSRLETLDQATKELEQDLAQHRQAVGTALRRLQIDARYKPAQFASELEKGLSRLSEWKVRIPQLLARTVH